ncbi:MAG: hypothetical protein E6H89_08185 [Chloroflexi bacterium]|nr:MAG: hypothetical protein E6H89_08185 [Chloroflexota bacterium]
MPASVAAPCVARHDHAVPILRAEDLDLVVWGLLAVSGLNRITPDEGTGGDSLEVHLCVFGKPAAIRVKSPVRTPSLKRRTCSSRRLMARS